MTMENLVFLDEVSRNCGGTGYSDVEILKG
jgi:hypothetical protein